MNALDTSAPELKSLYDACLERASVYRKARNSIATMAVAAVGGVSIGHATQLFELPSSFVVSTALVGGLALCGAREFAMRRDEQMEQADRYAQAAYVDHARAGIAPPNWAQ